MTAQRRGEDSEMKSKTTIGNRRSGRRRCWPTRARVGQILQGGGGKLSIAGSDPGEGRCEKPHEASSAAQASGKG